MLELIVETITVLKEPLAYIAMGIMLLGGAIWLVQVSNRND